MGIEYHRILSDADSLRNLRWLRLRSASSRGFSERSCVLSAGYPAGSGRRLCSASSRGFSEWSCVLSAGTLREADDGFAQPAREGSLSGVVFYPLAPCGKRTTASLSQLEIIPNLKIDAMDQPICPHPKSLSQGARDFEFGSLLPREKGWG
jgi:hypothetical protein